MELYLLLKNLFLVFFPLLSLPPFVHMKDLAHWLKNYMILSIFAYKKKKKKKKNHNNYKGGGGGGGGEGGIKKE